jgi:hypothetical protein
LRNVREQNIEKLKQMKVATTDLNIPVVPQTGRNADAIRANLKRVKLPPGFRSTCSPSCPMRATWPWRPAPTCCSSAPARPPSGP